MFNQVLRGFVTQQFYGGANGVFQVFGYGEGVFVGVFIQGVEQWNALARHQAVGMQQCGGGLESVVFAAAEDFQPVEAQQAVLIPFAAVNQQ